MRSGASVDHCRALSSVPRGARIDERSPQSASTRASVTRAPRPRLRRRRRASRRRSPPRPPRCRRESERSSFNRGECSRTAARAALPPAPGSSGAWNSTACAAASSSIATRALGVREHLPQLQPRGVPHRDVILLAGARRDRVHRGRMTQRLVLGDERRRDVLRDHEAAVQPAVASSGTRAGRPTGSD